MQLLTQDDYRYIIGHSIADNRLGSRAKVMLVVNSIQGGNDMKRKSDMTGVVVGRFQTSKLHMGHRSIIDYAISHHKNVLVVLGCAHKRSAKKNPLDYETRKLMIQRIYPEVRIVPLKDRGHDEIWSTDLDTLIDREFPGSCAILYGSRDSFIPHYTGQHHCISPQYKKGCYARFSATKLRNGDAQSPVDSEDFRKGVIYAISRLRPISYQTIDVAVLDYSERKVLLGGKQGEKALRFIGGFVDVEDESLEDAARRETYEETSGLGVDDFRGLGSYRIDDWRYRNTADKILTYFFAAQYIYGAPQASDDLERLEWVSWDNFIDLLVNEHKVLGERLMKHLADIAAEKGGTS
mgnify:CR=1 FL=1